MILSDPARNPEQVLIVALTTWEDYKDDSCMLDTDDHPFISHLSCVAYDILPHPVSLQQLESLMAEGLIKKREPLDQGVLAKMLDGAGESRFLPNIFHKILLEQNLID
ncbi:MAG: hypothetical protein ACOCZU_09055 [Planctomycetota bacterium]